MASTVQIEPKAGMITLDELKQTREFNSLSSRARTWVLSYIESNGDAEFATLSAFDPKTPRYASMATARARNDRGIKKVLALFYGDVIDERAEFFARLQRRIEGGKLTVAQLEGLRMLCHEKGWTVPRDLPKTNGYEPVERKFKPGQIAVIGGKKFKVTKVNEAGRPIEGDPVEDAPANGLTDF